MAGFGNILPPDIFPIDQPLRSLTGRRTLDTTRRSSVADYYLVCSYDFNVRKLGKSLQSEFDKLEAVTNTASNTLNEAGHVSLGTITQSNTVESIPGADHITVMEWNDSDLEYTLPFPASSIEDFDAWNGLFPPVNTGNLQVDVGRLDTLGPLDEVSFDTATARTAVPTPSNTPLVSSTISTPVTTTPGLEEHGLTQRTSLTMENLDSDTRNKILDILCQRRISTTIDVS
ncbi:hypothetical protein CONLIGDRAFT_650467 [Coniochaeta ligniaria NRRL 30616]|uniref:Uncharacterized protein n=1 Tax=Coniochaeta ligniaria NRRL 30616 TaxID=1408157 RepID=A0A1J7IYH1_9PEZI|nr:hypothetical protein CONLIGDRAFT_650467 [Coniochaeta ligniaria NRRL 30616]